MHRSPSANSILSNGATGTSSGGFQVSRNAKRLFKSGLGKPPKSTVFQAFYILVTIVRITVALYNGN